MKKRLGDRYDGRRIRHGDPFNVIIPFIMKARSDSQVFFDAEIDVSKVENLIRERRKSGENVSFLEYFLTVVVRTIAKYPRMNRFVAGRRVFARDDIRVSMVVKRELSSDNDETTVKFNFAPDSTVDDVALALKEAVSKNKGETADKNNTDKFVGILNKLPRWLLSFVVGMLKFLDFYGIMPKAVHELSPFHTSVFVTNMGSIGAEPIYHHIYDFGTTSIFIALGNKKSQRVINKDGKMVERKVMKLRFAADERIADGYYLSKSLKYFTSLFAHPELLHEKPAEINADDQI